MPEKPPLMSSNAQESPSTVAQSLEPTITRLNLQQRLQTDDILSRALEDCRDLRVYYLEGQALPYRAMQAGWIGHGDTIFESMAQLANKLVLAGTISLSEPKAHSTDAQSTAPEEPPEP